MKQVWNFLLGTFIIQNPISLIAERLKSFFSKKKITGALKKMVSMKEKMFNFELPQILIVTASKYIIL